MPAKQQTKMKRKLAESEDSEEFVGITSVATEIVPIPLNLSDDEKWMYLDFRSEMRPHVNYTCGRWPLERCPSRPKPSETDCFVPQ